MDTDAFRASLSGTEPPPSLGPVLQALWWDGKNDWDRAHEFAQASESDQGAAWVHAYLHRKEGDLANAGYWYRRAGRPVAQGALDEEWAEIATTLLASRVGDNESR